MEKFTVELTAANSCGVLHHISGVYAKCRINIDALTFAPEAESELAVMQVTSKGNESVHTHLLKLLLKLYDVKSVTLTQPK